MPKPSLLRENTLDLAEKTTKKNMTATKEKLPQDAAGPSPKVGIDIEALVQAFVEKAFAEEAKVLSERFVLRDEVEEKFDDVRKRRDQSSPSIAEADEELAKNTSSSLSNNGLPPRSLTVDRLQSTRVTFALNEEERPKDSSTLFIQNVIANDDDPFDAAADMYEDDVEEDLPRRGSHTTRRPGKHQLDDNTKYELSESTFSLLVTHPPTSMPFAFAVLTIALSLTCLGLTLVSSLQKGTTGNSLCVPGGVPTLVRISQFFGAFVGVIMEDEIPQGLQLIANGIGNDLLLDCKKSVRKKVLISSVFRLAVGYMFLCSMSINIIQSSDVIEIFYDVLALEFIENIDDITFALAKRGFFGKVMFLATCHKRTLELSGYRRERFAERGPSRSEQRLSSSGLIVSNIWTNHVVRFVYFLNAAIVLGGLGYITSRQKEGQYRCKKITALFHEETWEDAYVKLDDGSIKKRLLIYSDFNGIYREDGFRDGYPKYVEQNKHDGQAFDDSSRGAVIMYCREMQMWVFMHPKILKSPNGEEENGCSHSWLWRSPKTLEYDILSTTDGAWEAWIGEVQPLSQISITCNECSENADCGGRGDCKDRECECNESYYGDFCEMESPCGFLATEKAQVPDPVTGIKWEQDNPIRNTGQRIYNRPVYIQEGLSGQPFDMRLYKILERDVSSPPSNQPSNIPSISTTTLRSEPPISIPTSGSTLSDTLIPSHNPTPPLHTQIDYDTAPDFADWDDFFERQYLHEGMEDLMEDYSVILSYSGSRFYGTIVESNLPLGDLFPLDYHAFWSQSFNVDRTFIISDTTYADTPVGVDFFEMRRRINSFLNPNVRFSYGPFGALIPLMEYQGAGFFHCLDVTQHPSSSPSFSIIPSEKPTQQPSTSPTLSVAPSGKPSQTLQPSTSHSPTTQHSLIPTYYLTPADFPTLSPTKSSKLTSSLTPADFAAPLPTPEPTSSVFPTYKYDPMTPSPSPTASAEGPLARDDNVVTNEGVNIGRFFVLENDTPAPGERLFLKSVENGSNGLCIIGSDLLQVIFIPDIGLDGTDTCVYEACDSVGACDTATLTVTVEPPL